MAGLKACATAHCPAGRPEGLRYVHVEVRIAQLVRTQRVYVRKPAHLGNIAKKSPEVQRIIRRTSPTIDSSTFSPKGPGRP